jgi:hypothetical protein
MLSKAHLARLALPLWASYSMCPLP